MKHQTALHNHQYPADLTNSIPNNRQSLFLRKGRNFHKESNAFVHDDETESYSYHLAFQNSHHDDDDDNNEMNWTTKTKLDRWFHELHPSNFVIDNTTNSDGTTINDIAWTAASYKGETLLRQTAWVVLDAECQCEYGYSDTWQPISTNSKFNKIIQNIANELFPTASALDNDDDSSNNIISPRPNCCNLNYYPQGGGVGFHADDEYLFDGLNRPTFIVSLSLCATGGDGDGSAGCNEHNSANCPGNRLFQIQPKAGRSEDQLADAMTNGAEGAVVDNDDTNNNRIKSILLRHGDLVTMEGMFQKYYFHSVWPGDSKEYVEHPLTSGERINLTFRTIVQHLNGSPDECRGKTCPLSLPTPSASITPPQKAKT